MGCSRKHQHWLPSIINTDIDHSSHESDSSVSDSHSSDSTISSGIMLAMPVETMPTMETVPVIGKHAKGREKKDPTAPIPPSKVDYILTLFSAVKMKKPVAKCEPKKPSLQLSSDKPWDTLKAQLLVKIEEAFKPTTLSINDYNILFTIPHVVNKPGYPLGSATDYSILLDHSVKSRLVQLSISVIWDDNVKESDEAEKVEKAKKKKSHDPAMFPGNVKKVVNIQSLQEHWKYAKKMAECLGTYCFVNNEGMHLPLSHECLDCWAAAMVWYFLFFFWPLLIYYTAFWCYSRTAPESSLQCEIYEVIPCLAMPTQCTKPGSHIGCCSHFQLHHW